MSSRIAIVAGAGGGLGLATALRLHADGLTVVAVDRNKAGLEALPDEIHTEVADATDPTVPGPLVDRLTAEVGPPDVLVNTIGAYELGEALAVAPETLRKMMDVNLGRHVCLPRAACRTMQERARLPATTGVRVSPGSRGRARARVGSGATVLAHRRPAGADPAWPGAASASASRPRRTVITRSWIRVTAAACGRRPRLPRDEVGEPVAGEVHPTSRLVQQGVLPLGPVRPAQPPLRCGVRRQRPSTPRRARAVLLAVDLHALGTARETRRGVIASYRLASAPAL